MGPRRPPKIVDSCSLVDFVEQKVLRVSLIEVSRFHEVLVIPHVKVETENHLQTLPEAFLLRYFKRVIRDLTKQKVVKTGRKYDRLKSKFKKLKHYLKGIRARVEDTDRHIIALACQEKAEILTSDAGIQRALQTIVTARSARSWQPFAREVKINILT